MREQEGLYTPLGWLFSVRIEASPLFISGAEFCLSKLTVLLGDNCTGKTAICEWIRGVFDTTKLDRWKQPHTAIKYGLRYFCPDEMNIGLSVDEHGRLRYSLNGASIPFNPIKYHIVFPNPEPRRNYPNGDCRDEISLFSHIFSVNESIIEPIACEVNLFPHAKAKNLRFESEDGCRRLRLDLDGTVPGLLFASLSGREQETVLLEFATAIARVSGRYTPTLLILDGFISTFYSGWFDYFSHHFLDPENQFQTMLTSPRHDFELKDLQWNGWEVVQLSGKPPQVRFA